MSADEDTQLPTTEDAETIEERLDIIVDPFDVSNIMGLSLEPSYVSEIARKLRDMDIVVHAESFEDNVVTWSEISFNRSVQLVSNAVSVLESENRIETESVDYDDIDGSQKESSDMFSIVDPSDIAESRSEDGISDDKREELENTWNLYTIVHSPKNTNIEDFDEDFLDYVDLGIDIGDKKDIISVLSSVGNKMSRYAERIMQDVMSRQFRHYDIKEGSDYSSPGTDFYVEDDNRRDYGLSIEVSTRYVNPIDRPYVDRKKDFAFSKDSDLLIMAPRFTNEMVDRYEDPERPNWHEDVDSDMVHLHRVPNSISGIHTPFRDSGSVDVRFSGSPLIVPDGARTREVIEDRGRVSEGYPVVDEFDEDYRMNLARVFRDFTVIPESRYRNQLREALEPVLWEFVKPYKVEQYLIENYWDKDISTNEIGRLISRPSDESSGGHLSAKTIQNWISSNRWDVISKSQDIDSFSDETREIFVKMYRGDGPFSEVGPFSVFRIKSEYNRHPNFGLNDWEDFFSGMTNDGMADYMRRNTSWTGDITYSILVGVRDNITPTYDVIRSILVDEGVDLRKEDFIPNIRYNAYPNRNTMDCMINRFFGTFGTGDVPEGAVRDNDVEVFDSYFEVDFGTWLSNNGIPYAHEPFVLPGFTDIRLSSSGSLFNRIRKAGRGEDTIIYGKDSETVRSIWEDVFDKHNLQDSGLDIGPIDVLESFGEEYILPDFVVYKGAGCNGRSPSWNGWPNFNEIFEVSSAWGSGLPDDSSQSDFWRWYRYVEVARKEFLYKLLDIDDSVTFILPEQEGIPKRIRVDDNYLIVDNIGPSIDFSGVSDILSLHGDYVDNFESTLSPAIELRKYERSFNPGQFDVVDHVYEGLNFGNLKSDSDTWKVNDNVIVHAGYMGEVYLTEDSVHVRESQWRKDSMILIREYVMDVVSRLHDNGIVEGLREEF